MDWGSFLSGLSMFLVAWVIILVVTFVTLAVVVSVYRELKKRQ